MARERGLYLGPRLRRLRRDRGLTQADMAADLGISASYVALLEGNQRPVTADMLLRLARTFEVDLSDLDDRKSGETIARLERALGEPLFEEIEFGPTEIADVAASFPALAEAVLRLHTAYSEAQLALADNADGGRAADPVDEARRFLAARRNFFPALDEAAEKIAREVELAGGLEAYLEARRGLRVRCLPSDVMVGAVRRFDQHRNELVINDTLDGASRRFQLALQVAYFDLREAIDDALADGQFATDNARQLARRSLGGYGAAAILMPYQRFHRAAEERQYDVEALARTFRTSFEQASHRLTTLQRPGREGVPFFFVRVDAAGNISKRLDGAGFPFARHGGSCPIWAVHETFRRPRELLTQWIELPDGERFFTIARTVTAGGGAHGAQSVTRAVALGCAARDAGRLIYAEGRDIARETPTPIGVTCRVCHRPSCLARAEPPIGRQVLADEYRRLGAPFGFAD